MNEENQERSILGSYSITHYSDGTIDVANVEVPDEGVEQLENEEIYEDILRVAELIKERKQENMFARMLSKFYRLLMNNLGPKNNDED